MSDSQNPRDYPWLASDRNRGLATMIATVVVSIISAVVLGMVWPDPDAVERADLNLLLSVSFFNLLYIGTTHAVFYKADSETFRRWIRASTPPGGLRGMQWLLAGGGGVTWAISSSVIALLGLIAISVSAQDAMSIVVRMLGLLMITTCWIATVTAFAVQYARDYVSNGGMEFPGQNDVTWHEFGYLSLQIHTTFSSSDVDLLDTPTRRMVSRQSIIAFVFNTIIVAMTVSVIQK